jgi:zinc transporter 5/7
MKTMKHILIHMTKKKRKKDTVTKKKKKHGHSHSKGDNKNANIHGVYLHIIADTFGSLSVITSSLLIEWKGWTIADPICSFFISILIFVSVIPLLKNSTRVLLQTTPLSIEGEYDTIFEEIRTIPGVVGWRDPHFWQHSGSNVVGTIHIQTNGEVSDQKILGKVSKLFKSKGIENLTVEITHQH